MNKNLQEQVLRMSGVNPLKCMRCGKCSGTCPSYDDSEIARISLFYINLSLRLLNT